MKAKLFDMMLETLIELNLYNKWVFYDFNVDRDTLKNYDGDFIWVVKSSGTDLIKIDADFLLRQMDSEAFRYTFAQEALYNDIIVDCPNGHIILFSGSGMKFISKRYAELLWRHRRAEVEAMYVKQTNQQLPKNFKVRVRFDCPISYVLGELRYAREHGDESLMNCFKGLRDRLKVSDDHTMVVSRDFTEHSFLFCEEYLGRCLLGGGIIFHGFPETGYKQNGSVLLEPKYGWSIHT